MSAATVAAASGSAEQRHKSQSVTGASKTGIPMDTMP
jgi:hypothetical protein